MDIPPILKNKWVLIGGGLVVVIALVMAGGSGGSGGTAVVSSGPTDAQVAASTQITLATIAAQGQANQTAGQIALATQQGNNDLAKAASDAALSKYAIDAQMARDTLAANTSRDIQLADLASQERRDQASINATTQIQKWTLDQSLQNTQVQAQFQLDYAEAANATNVSLAQLQAQLVNNQLIVGRDVQMAGIASQQEMAAMSANLQRDLTYNNNATALATYQAMAGNATQQALIQAGLTRDITYSNNATVQANTVTNANALTQQIQSTNDYNIKLAQIKSDEELAIAKSNNSAKKHGSTMGVITSVVGGIASIFSDPRVKSDVVRIGERTDGLGIYHYRVPWAEAMQHGVMADEVAMLRPDALGPVVWGAQTVDYGALR